MVPPRLPAFHDQGRERGLLDRLLEGANRGRSAVLVIRAEAGVGKTALLRYAARQASDFPGGDRGCRGREGTAVRRSAPAVRPDARAVGRSFSAPETRIDVARALSPGEASDRFLVALGRAQLLSAAADERTLLRVVDDVQWLDRAA